MRALAMPTLQIPKERRLSEKPAKVFQKEEEAVSGMVRLYTQQKMDLPKPDRKTYSTFAQMFEDDEYPTEKKLEIIGKVYKFETHNAFTKDDLVAMIRWMFDQNYYFD